MNAQQHKPQKLSLPAVQAQRFQYIREQVESAHGWAIANTPSKNVDLTPGWAGGRAQALIKLDQVDAVAYQKNRNFLNGAVTHISPYLRHGCITLNETVDGLKQRFGQKAEKMIFELAWRNYWQLVWFQLGNKIYNDIEPPKVAIGNQPLSEELMSGHTGLPCMDHFIDELIHTGYLHNHARMWLASYIVHFKKMDWRAAADWFESYLLDGDLASNHLSWQWISATFSAKPYFFNKENLSRYTHHAFCASCKANCPFDDTYEALEAKLFSPPTQRTSHYKTFNMPKLDVSQESAKAIFVHDEMLSPTHPLLTSSLPKVFVFDPQMHGAWSLNRLQFIADCLIEMPNVEVWLGDIYQVLTQLHIGKIMTQDTPNLKLKSTLAAFNPSYQPYPHLVDQHFSSHDLKRFSKYWQKISPTLMAL